jgi:hypothetical protein
MAVLTSDTQRNEKLHRSQLLAIPVAADTAIWTGAIVCTNAAGLAVPGADAAGLAPHGVTHRGFDNRGGAAGTIPGSSNLFGAERFVQVDTAGEWEFLVSAGAPKPGGAAFIVDDNTVSANATNNNLKIGTFTRAGNQGGWFVDVERRG